MSGHDIAIAILTVVYTVIAARVAVVMRRQSNRIGEAGWVEFWLSAVWPMTMVFVGITILLFDAHTPGFEKASAPPSPESK